MFINLYLHPRSIERTIGFSLTHEIDIIRSHHQQHDIRRVYEDVARYEGRYQDAEDRSFKIGFQRTHVHRGAYYASRLEKRET